MVIIANTDVAAGPFSIMPVLEGKNPTKINSSLMEYFFYGKGLTFLFQNCMFMTIIKKLQSASAKLEKDQRERSELWWVMWLALKVKSGHDWSATSPGDCRTISKPSGHEAPQLVSRGTAAINRHRLSPYLNYFAYFLLQPTASCDNGVCKASQIYYLLSDKITEVARAKEQRVLKSRWNMLIS